MRDLDREPEPLRTADNLMKPEFIQTFIEETRRVFETMLGLRLEDPSLGSKTVPLGTFEFSASLGITGVYTGALVLSAPARTICGIYSRMVREPEASLDANTTDGIGELVNIIAGNACRRLGDLGLLGLSLSLPTFMIGAHRVVWHSRDLPCLVMRYFDSEVGAFCVEASLRGNLQR